MPAQKRCRSARRATGGRPGDRMGGRPARSARRRLRFAIAIPPTEALRRLLESTQYLAIRYTARLAEAGIAASVGSRGDSYDNALAESFHGLYKAELIHKCGPWRGLHDVEHATLDYIDRFNHRRLHGELGMVPPAEFEATYYHHATPARLAASQ
jgi:transposase InsO family protein